MVLLDLDGVIVSANQAWYDFCLDNDGDIGRCGVGSSYLDACVAAGSDQGATAVVEAIQSALAGQLVAPITLQIPCDAPAEPRWFDLLVSSRTDAHDRCVGATVSLSLSRSSRKPTRQSVGASAEIEYPDRPRLAMEGLVAELTDRVQQVLTAQARLHTLLRANVSLAEETDLSRLLELIVTGGRDLIDARRATLVRTGAGVAALIGPSDRPTVEADITVPIMVRGEAFATLVLGDSPSGEFSREDKWLAAEFATTAGQAIRTAQLVADHDRRARWQQALVDATRELLAGSDDQPLAVIARRAAIAAGNDPTAICTVDSSGNVIVAFGSLAQPERDAPDLDTIGNAIRIGTPTLNPALLVAPLMTEPAAIVVARASDQSPFEQGDLDQLEVFAHQVGIALSLGRTTDR